MAITNFGIDQGLSIFSPDIDTRVDIVKGSGVPGGNPLEDDAPIGSLFLRETGELYKKRANVGAPSDWDRIPRDEALDIFLTAAYDNTTNGAPANADSIELALGYLDANQLDLITLSGVPKGDTDLGSFTGNIVPDNSSVKQAIQSLENSIESISGGGTSTTLGVTTAQVLSTVLVDDSFNAEWEVVLENAADESNRRSIKLNGLHNGTPSADATTVDFSRFARNRVGTFFNGAVSVVLQGAGAAQEMGVEVQSTLPGGVNVYIRRTVLP